MKSHVADYATRVYCARVEPVGAMHPIIRLAGYPMPLTMSNGEVYEVEAGYEFSGISASSSFASGSVDLAGILDMGAISQDDLASGVYDNARVYVFATSWANPVEDEEPIAKMFWGKVKWSGETYTVELMGMIDALSQNVGRTYSPTCPWTLFDQTIDGAVVPASHSKCTGPRSAPDGPSIDAYKVAGTITSVTDQYRFADSSRAEPEDWFAYGEIMFTSGNNVGLKPQQLKSFKPGGLIELHEALFYAPQPGDTYVMTPGCRKRPEDCKNKFSNKRNFGGQDHVPVKSVASQVGRGA